MMNDKMIISERIFHIMDKKGLSQKDFSDKTGISPSTISDWKRKKTNPAADKIMLICDVLEITPYELLSGVEKDRYVQLDYVVVDKQSEDYLFLEKYRSLEVKKRYQVMGYMDALDEK